MFDSTEKLQQEQLPVLAIAGSRYFHLNLQRRIVGPVNINKNISITTGIFFYLLTMNKTVIIILAAGQSSRMDQPKQLLPFKNKTLLEHTASEALKSGMPVLIVLGANEKRIQEELKTIQAHFIVNHQWVNGVSTSIKTGLTKALRDFPETENCILSVCDQPYISASLFLKLLEKKRESKKNIIACSYANTLGTPVLFDKKHFIDLMHLNGDHGAKKLLLAYQDDVAFIPFEKGEIDLDTYKDYEEFLKEK